MLARRVARGDHRAFHRLYDLTSPKIQRRLTYLIGAVPEREDVLQEVFTSFFEALSSFRFEARATTFLHRITSNVACDHLRKRSTKARAAETSDEALGELAASMPDLVDVTIAKQHLSILMKGLLKLEPEERLAFVLVCVESLSADEAAEQMAVSPVTVRRYIKSARDKLARLIEPKAAPAVPPTLWRPI